MADTYDEERAYAECPRCGRACSGPMWRCEKWADEHEDEFPGHRVDITESLR